MPRSRALHVAARNLRFETACLAGPAGGSPSPWTTNAGIPHPHHVAIDSDPRTTRALFKGRLVDGVATVTDRVPALPAGTDDLRCGVHPSTMNGTLVVA